MKGLMSDIDGRDRQFYGPIPTKLYGRPTYHGIFQEGMEWQRLCTTAGPRGTKSVHGDQIQR